MLPGLDVALKKSVNATNDSGILQDISLGCR